MTQLQTVKKTYKKRNKSINGVDKGANGEFNDPRKSKLFFAPESELATKTELEELRRQVFTDRYSLRDAETGEPMEKYPEQMWRRVSKGISQFESTEKLQKHWEEKFFDTLKDFKFVPGGRILSGAGTGYEVTFFNCYVIPSPEDSRGGIMDNITKTVEIQSRAGGVGVNLSSLRPRGARVRKVNGTSSGPVNWAALYSTANHDVIQQGGSRRGALMLMINDWHPDVLEFIRVKEDLTKIPGANLSVCVSDKFMEAVKDDAEWDLVFPDYMEDGRYDELWNGELDEWIKAGGKIKTYKTVKAREVWRMIAEAAWRSAEPGLHFIERSNVRSNTWYFEKLIATNPCGEQPLGAWSVCNLGAMNLVAYVDDKGVFDYERLGEDVKVAMRFMDNVVDANFYFYPENLQAQMDIRRTGLGTMGLGDMLIKMKVKYGSDESLQIIEKVYRVIRDNAYSASAELAKEKGAFPKYDKEKYLQGWFIQRLPEKVRDLIAKNGIRNGVLLTQAPTGTTSLIAGVSSGIEPVYNFEFKRKDRIGERIMYHPLFQAWKEAHPGEVKPDYFVCAMDLTPEEHLKVQAKVQEYTDSSISKTVNAPNDYTVDDVERLYTLAYEWGCKGITFFRDGSRQGVLENITDKPKKEEAKTTEEIPKSNGHSTVHFQNGQLPFSPEAGPHLVTRPFMVRGATYKLKTPVGSAFITINDDESGEPLEVFINIGRAGSDVAAMADALGRTISTALRFRGSLAPKDRAKEISEQLSGIGGRTSVGFGPNKIRSLPDAVSVALSTHFGFRQNGVAHPNAGAKSDLAEAAMTANGSIPLAGLTQAGSAGRTDLLAATAESHFASATPIALEGGTQKVDLCPECGEHTLVFEEGCAKCYTCGHSEC